MHESEMLNAKCGLQIGYYYASDLVFMTSKNTIQLIYNYWPLHYITVNTNRHFAYYILSLSPWQTLDFPIGLSHSQQYL